MLNLEQQVFDRLPAMVRSPLFAKPVRKALKKLCHEQDFEQFLSDHSHRTGSDFVSDILDFFDFDYSVSPRSLENIPQQGRVVIYANHPIGSLDGIALLHMVRRLRPDVRIVANELLWGLAPLRPLLLPVTNMGGRAGKQQLTAIQNHLNQHGAVIIFPSGEVSRLHPHGVRDGKWQSGFLKMAERTQAPLVPIHVQARNSWSFYSSSIVNKAFGTLLLIEEMFKHRHGQLRFTIGAAHPAFPADAKAAHSDYRQRVLALRHSLYALPRQRQTQAGPRAIAHAESALIVRDALKQHERLLKLPNGLEIYAYYAQPDCPVMRELGRVREQVFRAIGEGTSQRCDIDRFDMFLTHLVLWQPERMEIAGSYRLGNAGANLDQYGLAGVYTASLFKIHPDLERMLERGIELGRSFVVERYRDRHSLDYLWQGIGCFLRKYPQQRYLFGPVSLSGAFPQLAKDLIVQFYTRYYSPTQRLALPNHSFTPSTDGQLLFQQLVEANPDQQAVFREVKAHLKQLDCAIPPLFKQYSELCEAGGVQFAAFSVDPDFNNSVDGLVIVDLLKLKPAKRERYIDSTSRCDSF